MPTTKKTAAPKAAAKKSPAKKKAPAKKAAPKKAPAKKPAPKPTAPEKYRSIYLVSNSGEKRLTFKGDKAFNDAIEIIKSAPSEAVGRSPEKFFINGYEFQTVSKYEVTEH